MSFISARNHAKRAAASKDISELAESLKELAKAMEQELLAIKAQLEELTERLPPPRR